MYTAKDQQIEICMLKYNLKEVEDDLVVQRSALPALESENKQKCNETMTVLRVVRSLNTDIEKLRQENVRLTAKRVQLKRQCDELSKDLETARKNREDLTNYLKQEESETELQIRQYEDSLAEKADRFRRTHVYYDEAEINRELENESNAISKLESEFVKKQNAVGEMKIKAEGIRPVVPEDLLEICGQKELDEKLKALNRV